MRYDKQIKLFESLKVENGMGGFVKENVLMQTVLGYATPIKLQTIYANGMLVTKQTIKIFTKENAKDCDFKKIDFLEYDGITYNILNYADFGKIRMFEVEVNGNG